MIRKRLQWTAPLSSLALASAYLAGCAGDQLPVPLGASEIPAATAYQQLAASPSLPYLVTAGFPPPPDVQSHLYLLEIDTGQEMQLTTSRRFYDLPDWSHVSTKIAITIDRQIAVADPLRFAPTVVAVGDGAAWSSTEEQLLVYAGPRGDDQSFHRVLRVIDGTGNLLREVPVVLPLGSRLHPPLSPLSPTVTPAGPMETPMEWINGITWSPNGDLALVSLEASYGAPANPNIREALLIDVATGASTFFAPNTPLSRVEWSPDGDMIAYIKLNSATRGTLILSDALGGCLAELGTPPEVEDVSWSMDGESVLFLYDGRVMELEVDGAVRRTQDNGGCG